MNEQWINAEKVLVKCSDSFHRLGLDKSPRPADKFLAIELLLRLGESCERQHPDIVEKKTFENALVLVHQLPESKERDEYYKRLNSTIEFLDSLLENGGRSSIQKMIRECPVGNENRKAKLYNALCGAYLRNGDFELGLETGYITLSIARRVDNQGLIGDILATIAANLYNTGKTDESLSALEEALPILRATLGNKSVKVAQNTFLLGEIYERQWKHDNAIKMFKKAFRNMRRAVGDENIDTKLYMRNLLRFYVEQDKYLVALAFMEKEEPLMRRVFLEKYDTTFSSLREMCFESE
jgi:tetratricopeptide (TPR) repeat protein